MDSIFLRVRFCGIVESSVDSAELQNRWWIKLVKEKGLYFWQKPKVAKAFTHCVRDSVILHFACEILRNCGISGGFESLRGERTLLLAKAKSSKNFCALCARFCNFVLCV